MSNIEYLQISDDSVEAIAARIQDALNEVRLRYPNNHPTSQVYTGGAFRADEGMYEYDTDEDDDFEYDTGLFQGNYRRQSLWSVYFNMIQVQETNGEWATK
ncbi:hypothetical protein DPMN_063797 [Dreissena polymorpha]|uniref:Uncharacterized protein n=1 Tax=Dreissena polymorpha TaxID=45954 RepID=A0A9D4CC51_DREPO|nr:hypothetical protein DPMN_063797 [Dreissena polymorpha]